MITINKTFNDNRLLTYSFILNNKTFIERMVDNVFLKTIEKELFQDEIDIEYTYLFSDLEKDVKYVNDLIDKDIVYKKNKLILDETNFHLELPDFFEKKDYEKIYFNNFFIEKHFIPEIMPGLSLVNPSTEIKKFINYINYDLPRLDILTNEDFIDVYQGIKTILLRDVYSLVLKEAMPSLMKRFQVIEIQLFNNKKASNILVNLKKMLRHLSSFINPDKRSSDNLNSVLRRLKSILDNKLKTTLNSSNKDFREDFYSFLKREQSFLNEFHAQMNNEIKKLFQESNSLLLKINKTEKNLEIYKRLDSIKNSLTLANDTNLVKNDILNNINSEIILRSFRFVSYEKTLYTNKSIRVKGLNFDEAKENRFNMQSCVAKNEKLISDNDKLKALEVQLKKEHKLKMYNKFVDSVIGFINDNYKKFNLERDFNEVITNYSNGELVLFKEEIGFDLNDSLWVLKQAIFGRLNLKGDIK